MSDTQEYIERVRSDIRQNLKWSVTHHRLELAKIIEDGYPKSGAKYIVAWAEWIIHAKQYTLVKNMRVDLKKV